MVWCLPLANLSRTICSCCRSPTLASYDPTALFHYMAIFLYYCVFCMNLVFLLSCFVFLSLWICSSPGVYFCISPPWHPATPSHYMAWPEPALFFVASSTTLSAFLSAGLCICTVLLSWMWAHLCLCLVAFLCILHIHTNHHLCFSGQYTFLLLWVWAHLCL